MRTVGVFMDLPFHLELEMGRLPIISLGYQIEFEMGIQDKNNPEKVHEIEGLFEVKNVINKYDSGRGLTQYLEFIKIKS